MQQITIPATIEEVGSELNSDWQLVTAKEWRRAAIVYAFTRDGGQGESPSRKSQSSLLTTGDFAKLGFHGLTSTQAIAGYRDAWKAAMADYNAPVPQPGMSLEIGADWKWPPTGRPAVNSITRLRDSLVADPAGTVGKIIRESPEATSALARGVTAHPQVVALVLREVPPALVRPVTDPGQRLDARRSGG